MSFYNQFLSHFTTEEQNTELVKLWQAIGTNAEKTDLEYMYSKVKEFTDISNFSDDTSQSWLGFFMRKVPNRISPECNVTLTIDSSTQTVVIPKGTILTSSSGNYITESQVSINPGGSATFKAKQGVETTQSGTYNSMISIAAEKIDLSTIVLTLTTSSGTVTVPEVSYETSYVGMNYMGTITTSNSISDSSGTKGMFYIVNETGTYNFGSSDLSLVKGQWIVYNGTIWTQSLNTQNYSPNQLGDSYAKPYNGYYAFYSDGYLYLRIFSGDDVPDPENLTYTLTYVLTNGIQGEIDQDKLSFQDEILDNNSTTATYTLSNEASTKGMNEASSGLLKNMLRQTFYSTTSISTVPEYKAWFNAQPEIGDCRVYTDYEEYLRTGDVGELTGYIYVLLINNQGKQLDPQDNSDAQTINTLLTRIEPYKDVGFLKQKTFTMLSNVLQFRYLSSSDDTSYQSLIKTVAENFYSMDYLQENGESLFNDVDLSKILNLISSEDTYNGIGLSVTGWHEVTVNVTADTTTASITSYDDETLGDGYYLFYPYVLDSDGNITYEDDGVTPIYGTSYKLYEVIASNTDNYANIYYRPQLSNGIATPVYAGIHYASNNTVSLNFTNLSFFAAGKIDAYFKSSKNGILSQGGVNIQRRLPSSIEGNTTVSIEIDKYE